MTTLVPVVERLQKRFGVKKACVAADRGMISADTIAALQDRGIDYILGVRERSVREVREQVIEDDGVAVPLVIPRQKGHTQLDISEVTCSGRRYILCRNEEQANKDAETRAALIAGLEHKLAQSLPPRRRGATRRSSPIPGTAAFSKNRKARGSSSTPPKSRLTPGSTASSCCAPA